METARRSGKTVGQPIRPWLVLAVFVVSSAHAQRAPLVWPETTGGERMQVAYFRREVVLAGQPQQALLHLFADARYVLTVNQTTLGTGPVRFYPERPFYDTYDLRPFLRPGKNVIAVKVLSPGIHTFQTPRSPAGFAAWGAITDAAKRVHSLTVPGNWRSRPATGYDRAAPKMTFAFGPMEVFDARNEPDDWQSATVLPERWQRPRPVTNQDHWGTMAPRPIPFLTQDVVLPRTLTGAFALKGDETQYSFRINTPDANRDQVQQRANLLAVTGIHSISSQTVVAGLIPGDYHLNGQKLEPVGRSRTPQQLGRANWQPYALPLHTGWNPFVASGRATLGVWEFLMALPKTARLRLSPRQQLPDSVAFYRSPPYREGVRVPAPDSLSLIAGSAMPPAGWLAVPREQPYQNPVLRVAWQPLGQKKALRPDQTSNLTLTDSAGSALVYDFGGKQLGRVFVEYDAPAGTVFDLGFSEDTLGDKAFVLKRGGLYIGAKHIASGRSGRFETISPYGLRYLQLNVSGSSGQPVTVRRVGVVTETYPLEKRGSFRCSDPLLNDIWELGWRTLQVCSEDTYIDTPFRERGLYAGDAVPEYGMALVTDGSSQLLKQSLVTFEGMYAHLFEPGRQPDENFTFGAHDDYPLLALQALVWYVTRTNDLDYARRVYPKYAQLLATMQQHRDADGFYRNQMRPFIEWTTIDKDASPLTAVQLFWAQGMRDMAILATRLGRRDEAARYEQQRADLVQRINQTFWDEEKNAYIDGFKNGEKLTSYFPITGALAVLYGISSPAQSKRILDYVETELADIGTGSRRQRTSTYGSFYILEALYRNGRAGSAEAFIRRYWSPMVVRHHDTAWENFDDYGIGTLSHAWSGHPTYLLSTQALGVNLEYPDAQSVLDSVTIAPQSEMLTWATGVVPHPAGSISVDWRVEGTNLFLDCTVPEGIQYTVKPRGRLSALTLWVNGKKTPN